MSTAGTVRNNGSASSGSAGSVLEEQLQALATSGNIWQLRVCYITL
jgi:hypothetical protein